MSEAIGIMTDAYAEAGIEISVAGYHQVSTELAILQTLEGPDNDLDVLFTRGQQELAGLNLFIVDSIVPGSRIAGASPVVGAPGVVAGESSIGVVVAIDGSLGNIIAHECGHFLGLLHTTEVDGVTHDQFPDTPIGGLSAGNMMSPVVSGRDRSFSVEQGEVLRASPLVLHQR